MSCIYIFKGILFKNKYEVINFIAKYNVDDVIPPPPSSPPKQDEDKPEDINFMQNDFYLNDTGLGVITHEEANAMLLERRNFLNSVDDINNINWDLELKIFKFQDGNGRKTPIKYNNVSGGILAKVNNAPMYTITATTKEGKKIILQEYRDLRNGWGISRAKLKELGIKEDFLFTKEITNSSNFKDFQEKYAPLYSVIEYLEQNNKLEDLEKLYKSLGINENYLRQSFQTQKMLEKGFNKKINIKLKRILSNYTSTKKIDNKGALKIDYQSRDKIENLPNSVVIDKDGKQYTAILDLDISFNQEISKKEGVYLNDSVYRQDLKDAIGRAKFLGTITSNPELEQEIIDKLKAQLDEKDKDGNYIFSPATFLNNGFNLIFTDTVDFRPFVKPLISAEIDLPNTNTLLNEIKTNGLEGDVRAKGWFINVTGVQEQLKGKFEVVKVEFNNYVDEKLGDISGITVLYIYKDAEGNDVFWRKNYALATNKPISTNEHLSKKIKESIEKHFGKDKIDISKLSVNFVNSNVKKPTTYEDAVKNNPYVIKGINYKNSNPDMRNGVTYSFHHDRVGVVEAEENVREEQEEEIIPTVQVAPKNTSEPEVVIKEQKFPAVKETTDSKLMNFLKNFSDIKLGGGIEGVVTIVPENYHILEEFINENEKIKLLIFDYINEDSLDLTDKIDAVKLELSDYKLAIIEKIKNCKQ